MFFPRVSYRGSHPERSARGSVPSLVPVRPAGVILAIALWAGSPDRCDAVTPESADRPAAPSVAVQAATRPLLVAYCGSCHGADDPQAGFRVDTLPATIDSSADADRWQRVLGVMNAGEMPPEKEKQLDAAAKADLLDDLAHAVMAARRMLAGRDGGPMLRRLNRREYANTIRDLLGVEVDVRELPADVQPGSFDTIAASLFMSADQIEQLEELGGTAVDEAWRRYGGNRQRRTLHVEAEEQATAKVRKDLDTRLDARKRFLVWKEKVEAAAAAEANREAVAEIRRLAPRDPDAVLKASQRLTGAPSPQDFGWTDGIHALHEGEGWWKLNVPHHQAYASHPLVASGSLLSVYDVYVHPYQSFSLPGDWPPGDYVLRMRLAALDDAPPQRRFIEYGRRHHDYAVEGCREVTGTLASPQILEIPISLTTAASRGFWIYEKGIHDTNEKAHRFFFDAYHKNGVGPPFAIWIDWLEAEGPLDGDRPPPPAVADILAAAAADRGPAAGEREIRGMLERFAVRAFRGRQPEPAYLDRLVEIVQRNRAAGKSFAVAVREPLAIVLASPQFLYLAEPAAEGGRRRLDGGEVATRLAYFLWGGPPDDALLEAAAAGDLSRADLLAAHVDRMLADPRSRRFVEAFVHQWLSLDRLDLFQFDDTLYPDFDLATKALAKQEVFETVGLLIRERGSLQHLLESDFVVVNAALGRYYALAGVSGDAFRKVPLPAGSPRGGLLGMAAILAMGSNGQQTSPVERGAWVLRKLVHDPPPPAPPNVPQLSRFDGTPLSARERLRMHQEQPQCGSCHRRIDPIGFGLENFDAAGRWRTQDASLKESAAPQAGEIDASGAFHGGPAFADFFGLRRIVGGRIDAFATGFTEALLEYALGRPVGFSDEALVRGIVAEAAAEDYSVRAFIEAVVRSEAFRTR